MLLRKDGECDPQIAEFSDEPSARVTACRRSFVSMAA
jgi:hypothetical protein